MAPPDSFDLGSGEASALIGCHQSTLTRWAEDGRIAHLKTPGGHLRFRRSDVEAFLAASTTEAKS